MLKTRKNPNGEDSTHCDIQRYISPFQGKDTFVEAFSTYLEANSLNEKMPCGIIKPSNETYLLMKITSGIMDPFYALKGKRSKTSHLGRASKHDMWQERMSKEERPCLRMVPCHHKSTCMLKGGTLMRSIPLNEYILLLKSWIYPLKEGHPTQKC